MADSLAPSTVGVQPGGNAAPTPELLNHVMHMQQMMTVAQSFVDPKVINSTQAGSPQEQLAARLYAGNMSPEAQEIEYQRRLQLAIERGEPVESVKYPVGTNQFTKEDAATFANKYTVKQTANDATGFSGTVITEIVSENQVNAGYKPEIVVALRDTEFRPNDKGGNATQDVSGADTKELFNNGAAVGQIAQAAEWFKTNVISELKPGEQVSIASGSLSGHIGQALQILFPEHIKSEPNANVSFNGTNLPTLRDPSGQLSEKQILEGIIKTYTAVRNDPSSARDLLLSQNSGDNSLATIAQQASLIARAETAPAADPNSTSGTDNYYDNPREDLAITAVRAKYESYGLKPTTTDPYGSNTVDRPGNLTVIGTAMAGADVTLVPSLGVGNSNILVVPIHGQNAIVTGGSYTDIGNNHGFYTLERPLSLLAVMQEARQAAGQPLLTMGEFRALAERSGVETAGVIQGSTTASGATESDSYPNLLNFMRETFLPAGTTFRATTGNSSAYGEASADARAAWYADIKELQAEIKTVVANGGSLRTIDIAGLGTQARLALALEDSPTGDAVRFALKQGSPVATVVTNAEGLSLVPQHRGSTAIERDDSEQVTSSFEDSIRAQNNQYELTIQGREQNNPGYRYQPPTGLSPNTESESSTPPLPASSEDNSTLGQCTPDDPDTAALTPAQVAAADANSASSSGTLDSVLPYAQGLNSALSLIQALEQGNTLSAVMAGASLANTLNKLTDGAIPTLPGELSAGLTLIATGLNLLDALDNGDTLGALSAGTNLASQAAGLWANTLRSQSILATESIVAEGLAAEASSAAALSSTLGQIAGAFGVLNSLANGDPLGAVSGLLMMNPATAPIGIALSIGRALFGGLFGDDDGGEPPYIIVKASGDAHFVRHDDGSIGIESSGTNQHKSTEGTAVGAGTQGGQAVASALGALLADLQSQVDAHNAAHPEAPFALVPERLPQLHWRDPAYYAEWTDAASGEPRSIAVSARDLAGDLLAVAQSGAAVVPAWLADTVTQRIEAGDTAAWRPAPTPEAAGDTQAQAILVLGSGAMDRTARSDIDADGWSEAHAWSANNLYLTVDSNGDGQIEGLRDLVTLDGEAHAPNRLGWLDADGNGLLDSNDPGFAALKLWLDANGDAVAQDGESAGLQAAGIVAIDFRSYPPALVDAAGNATALTETQLTGDTKGIRTAQTDSGIQVAVEDGETVLLATRTTDYTGDEAHTHREEIAIDAGGARLQSQAAAAPAVVRTESRIEAGDARLKSGAARPVGVAPAATAEQELRSVTAQLISDSQNLFAAAGGLLTVMAFGAGAAQAGTLVEVPPAPAPAETTGDVPAYAAPTPPAPAGTMDTGAALYAVPAVTPAVAAPTPPWTVTDIAVVVPALPNSLPAAAEYVPPAANVQAAPNAPAPAAPESTDGQASPEPAPAPENDTTAPVAAGATAPATETDDAYCLLQPQAGDDVLDDRTEDQAFRIAPAQLLANDGSDAATPLSVVALGAAEHGRVERLADGDIAFFPEADYFGPAAFAYTVGNAFGQTAQGRVAFTIRPVNDAPAVADETAAGTEDTALLVDSAALLANDADVDTVHADLRLTAVSGASHGTVALAADGTVRFTPEADWFGSAGFDYTVADGVGGETQGHVELMIAAVNDAPVAAGETVDSAEDEVLLFAPAALLANDADIDNAAADLRIAAVSAASHGTVALDADGSVRFTPDANYFGAAGFDYTVADGAGGTAQAHVDLAMAAVNDAPTVAGEAAAGKANVSMTFTPAALLANDSDIDDAHDALTIAAVGNASHGTVALLPDGRVRFTPETDYTGTGSFSYTVADAQGATTAGQVSIDLAHANIAPTAVDDGFTGDEDIPFVIAQSELLANDSDSDNAHADLAVTAVGSASHGTVALQQDGSIRFTPTANYYGSASFTYTVADGDGGQMQAQALLNVRSVNDAPVVETIEYGMADYGFNFQQMWATACIYNDGYYYYPELKSIITPEHSEQTGLNFLHTNGYLRNSGGYLIAPTYYLNGHLKPVELDQLDGGAATTYTDYYDGHTTVAAYSDDPYTTPGRIVVYDPDGNSDAFTMSLERAPAHGSVNLGGYAINYSWNNVLGGWKYNSTMGDAYCGADPFQVRITDAGGASTVVTVNTTHYGSSFGGGGGGGGGCPIAIDLDRDGVELVAPDDSQVFADVNGDGWRDRIGWVGNDDGLLALDRDGDGRVGGFDEISFAHDLPGTHTDLEGLRAHDSDGDGYISAGDADWSRFGIWRDADGNGMQEDGEFRSLAEMGVARIGLTGDGKLRTDHGNVVFGETRIELTSGESLAAADVMFAGADVPYPLAVQQALAAAADTSSAAPLLDEAELARRAQAFVQACAAAPADDSPPLAFVAAAEAAWLPPAPDWQTPPEQTVAA